MPNDRCLVGPRALDLVAFRVAHERRLIAEPPQHLNQLICRPPETIPGILAVWPILAILVGCHVEPGWLLRECPEQANTERGALNAKVNILSKSVS
eukprot:3032492-Alexandrium_andersonii.AAC.1